MAYIIYLFIFYYYCNENFLKTNLTCFSLLRQSSLPSAGSELSLPEAELEGWAATCSAAECPSESLGLCLSGPETSSDLGLEEGVELRRKYDYGYNINR